MEEWRSIKSYEGIYEVSSWGRVRSLDGIAHRTWNGIDNSYVHKGKIRKLMKHTAGYLQVALSRNDRRLVHRLVAEAFIPNPDNLPFVNHKDLDKTNNHVENLEWISLEDNNRHAVRNGVGGGAKLRREVTILRNGKEIGTFPSYQSAAKFLQCSPQQIMTVVAGRNKTAKGCTFRVK